MSKIPVTVCIIAKNEEKHIEECLKHLAPYGFEIIVTDTGSTDRTKEIAQKYADQVLDFEWINDFSAARNFCAAHASNNWIMSIDCDEYVNTINVQALRILMQRYPRFTGMFRLKNLVQGANGMEKYSTDDVTRVYNRNFFTYINPIHEQIAAIKEEKRTEIQQTFIIPMEVIHHGYNISPEEMRKKQLRNLDMLYQALESRPQDAYTLFQIGQSEFIIGNYEKAVESYEKALSTEPNIDLTYVQILIESAAKAYCQVDREADALTLMNKYAKDIKTAKFVFHHAGVLLANNQPLKALLLYLKATTLSDADTLGENLINCYENIMAIYRQMGQDDMADMFIERYNECLAEKERVLNA